MNDNYELIKHMKLAAPSTISGWRKQGHPEWVDQLYLMEHQLKHQDTVIAELRVTVRTLSSMVQP